MIRRALKEWDAICRAIAAGRVDMLVRKSGILDADAPIEAGPEPFALMPTFEHQRAERLVPDVAALIAPDPSGGRTATISLVVEVLEERLVTDADALEAVGGAHALTREHVLERIAYGRRRGVRAIRIRASRLSAPVTVELTARIRGCVSWVDLPVPIEPPARKAW